MSASTRPKVTVLVLTYNHDRYVAKALAGALSQNTSFKYEILVAEDCSTDRTVEVVGRIALKNPALVRILPRPENLGICRNFVDAYRACGGEYVAILEGDDEWHNPGKLEKLISALDRRPDCSFAFHDVRLRFEDGREEAGCCPPHVRPELHLRDFLAHNHVPNCSALVFRNGLVDRFPSWFTTLSYYDWPLHVLHLQRGPALYLNEPLSTYRIHSGGAWHGAGTGYRLEKLLEIFAALNEHLGFEYDTVFRTTANFWRVQAENEVLRRTASAAGQRSDAAGELERVLNSRSFRFARRLSRAKGWMDRTLRRRAA
jgi:glycosyltransferase involved in cell wall biosynthesis